MHANDAAPPGLQRSRGSFQLSVGVAGPRAGAPTRIRTLGQVGCLKLLFPRTDPSAPLEAVMVNISGGIAAGDKLSGRIACLPGSRLVVASQAAERCYRARACEDAARVDMSIRLDAGASLDWLPQETILFDGAVLERRLEVDMEADARFLGIESRVFGRVGSGETVNTLRLRDSMRIRRGGRLCFVDALKWDGDAAAALARPAIGNGATLSAMIVLVSPDAPARLGGVRAALGDDLPAGVSAAASAWNGLLVVRVLSKHDIGHRRVTRRVLERLLDQGMLPRVWQG